MGGRKRHKAALRYGVLSGFFALALSTFSFAAPQLLAEWQFDPQHNFLWGFNTVTSQLDWIDVRFGPTANFSSGPGLFETASIHAGQASVTFTANASNDSDFPAIEALLTNAQTTDRVFVTTGLHTNGAAGADHPESYWAAFNSSPASFTGYDITSIDMFVKNISFVSPGTDPNHNGQWTDFTLDRYFRIYGQPLPEPSVAATLATLAMCFGRRRRRASGTER